MANLPDDWAGFIFSPHHAGRFLYPVGEASYSPAPELAEDRVQRFHDRLSRAAVDVPLLARLYLLLSPPFTAFVVTALPALLRSVSHATTGASELSRRGVRGKILWPPTLRSRASGKADAGSFAVRRAERSSEVPENQLLKRFLTDIVRTVDSTAKEVGTGAVLDELKQLRRHSATALKTPYLKEIESSGEETALMRRRARRHRNHRYRQLADLQADFDAAIHDNKWAILYRLLRSGWLKPVRRDDLFELYLLVLLLDILANELKFGDPIEYGLIRPKRKHVARFLRGDGAEVRVYFDQSPREVFGTNSEYGSLRARYTFPHGKEHRPDISLRFGLANDPERRVLVEGKETADDDYMRGSVYKAFAYLYDFRAIWEMTPNQNPKAILVFPDGVALLDSATDVGREMVLASGELTRRDRLAELLAQALSS